MTEDERKRFIDEHPESLNAALYRYNVAVDEAWVAFQKSREFALMQRFLLWVVRLFDRGEAV